jgi:hypothetical protein
MADERGAGAPIFDPLEKHLKAAQDRMIAALTKLTTAAAAAVAQDAPEAAGRHELAARVDAVGKQYAGHQAALGNLLKEHRSRGAAMGKLR